MNVDDIPKLTRRGSKQLTVSLDYFKHYLENRRLIMNPEFHRGHVWTQEQQVKFVEFILSGGDTNNVIYFNYDEDAPRPKNMLLVDGLQRVTAVQKFLNGDLAVFGGHKIGDFTGNMKAVLRHSYLHFNVNNLKTYKEVLKWYLEMNSNGTPHTHEEIERVRSLLDKAQED